MFELDRLMPRISATRLCGLTTHVMSFRNTTAYFAQHRCVFYESTAHFGNTSAFSGNARQAF
jgi:hypothetical protein